MFTVVAISILGSQAIAQSHTAKPKAKPQTTPATAKPNALAEKLRLSYYDYDAKLPLNATLSDELPSPTKPLTELRKRYRVEYDSAHDQRVTAILSIPNAQAAKHPAIVLLAGSGGHKDTDYVRLASDMFCTMGYVTISIDAQYHGERSKKDRTGDIHLLGDVTNRDAWVQTVIDLRRAVDFLISRPEVDATKIGYLGFSQGGMIGATFIGVEPRIHAACLAVAGGGFPAWSKVAKIWKAEQAATLDTSAEICDPINFIGRFSPRPLLFINAKRDELIPASASEALHKAAKEPKEIAWFNSGHVIPPTALLINGKQFFTKHLGSLEQAKH
jgi:cephalosporin-C deacetylase-like acetyl esterase